MSLSKLFKSSQVETSDLFGQPTTRDSATIADLPPEILTFILEYLLDGKRNTFLRYRLINSEWKSIIDSHLEKKMISGRLAPFPTANPGNKWDEPFKLYAACCPTLFSEGRNPFPFNALFVDGTVKIHPDYSTHLYEVPTTLIGSNLSYFAVSYSYLTIHQLSTMLGRMPFLKRLCLRYVSQPPIIRVEDPFPSPPPLLCFTSLDLKIDSRFNKNRALGLWLVVSYADQLVQLTIESTDFPFEPLQKQYEYRALFEGHNIVVGATSRAAFGKLKQLKVYRPDSAFFQLSETPALQHFSVNGLEKWSRAVDLRTFIDGCNNTLETLCLDVNWDDWVNNGEALLGRVATKLKTIRIRYPNDDITLLGKSSLLKLAPGLEVLQLTCFRTQLNTVMMSPNCNEISLEIHSGDDEELAELKQQLVSREEREAALRVKLDGLLTIHREKSVRKTESVYGAQNDGERRAVIRLWKEIVALRKQIDIGRLEKVPLINRLFVLNRKAVIAWELWEQGIWNCCPKLKIISVSSGAKVSGDVCVLCRMDIVGLQ